MNIAKLREWWFVKQGLARPGFGSAEDTLSKTGWARSVGGVNPYLTIFSRSGLDQAAIEREVASCGIHELPSARGCTYVIPRQDFALALSVAANFSNNDLQIAKRHLGYSEAEHHSLEEAVLKILTCGPMDPRQMKTELGDRVRSFGEEGKKRGLTTNLPMALGTLQIRGLIRRLPAANRLDTQKFSYTLANLKPVEMPSEKANSQLARRYFSWIGPATIGNFQWFSGLGAGAARAAVETLGLVAVESEFLMLPEDAEAYADFRESREPCVRLVASIDGIVHLRRDTSLHIDDEDRSRAVYGERGRVEMFTLVDLPHHGIFDRGRLIGLWEFDVESSEIVADCFVPMSGAIKGAIDETQDFVRGLGDARMVSLDSPQSRKARIGSLRTKASVAS